MIFLRNGGAFAPKAAVVDRESRTISGVSIITAGPALGHGFLVDQTMLGQVADAINAKAKGVKSRMTHPGIPDCGGWDGIETMLGRVSNARVEGNQVFGDLAIGAYAAKTPAGDIGDYVMTLAEEDPEIAGMSIVFEPSGYDERPATKDEPNSVVNDQGERVVRYARVKDVMACDMVGDPAANPAGMLSRLPLSIKNKLPSGLLSRWAAAANPATVSMSQQAAGASPTAQPLRKEIPVMETSNTVPAQPAPEVAPAPAVQPSAVPAAALSEPAAVTIITDDGDKLLAQEGKRVSQIQQLGNVLRVPAEVVNLSIAQGHSVIDAKASFLKHLSEAATPVAAIKVGQDRNRASLAKSLPQALMLKMGRQKLYAFDDRGQIKRDGEGKPVAESPDERAYQLRGLRFRDMFREYLTGLGANHMDVARLSDEQLAKCFTWHGLRTILPAVALAGGGQGVDDFDSILANVQNKSMRIAYMEIPATWQVWAGRRTTSDFKQISDTQLSDVPDLLSKDEHGRYRRVQISDSKETWRLGEFGHIVAISRRALLNDDLNAFASIPMKEASAARRLEETTVYAVLTANAAMNDGGLLFNATAATSTGGHANLSSSTAEVGAPSVTTLNTGRTKMRLQTAPKGAILNLVPQFLIVPAALENLAYQYTSAAFVPAVSTNINAFAQGGPTPLTPVVQPRLDANSSTAWYLAADPMQIDTVKICFLESEPDPVLEQNTDFYSDDVEYKVRHAVAATALDHRGLYKNNGA